VKRQRKALPKKTNNAEVVGKPSHDDSEGARRDIDRRFDLGTRKLPQVLLKYKEYRDGAIKNDYKYKAPHQKHNYETSTHGTGTIETHKQKT